jgi:hypothetical protein
LNLLSLIHSLFSAINRVHARLAGHAEELDGTVLPRVLVTVARDEKKYGHITTVPAWESNEGEGFLELMVTGEGLTRGGRAVFGTKSLEFLAEIGERHGVGGEDARRGGPVKINV